MRLIQPEDAEYVHGLRINPVYNRYLSEVRGTADDQRRWIEAYKSREAQALELYYIIERCDGRPCGTVRLYDIQLDRFTWGSWILDGSKPPKAALESAVLSFGVGFQELGLDQANVDVRIANAHAEAFYRRFGMTEAHRTAQDIFFVLPRARFAADHSGYLTILAKEATR
ncbi:GNAT family N-acetyltransferase [Flavimaricola sp.]|nr:GNAT family N-acetyltransferase [Flavimaricola sp.]MDA9020188.1 GNAT family N-acetyltransferase [Flavimaricola sp.]